MSKRIAIIGAGISGLSIAYQLLEQHHKVVVYEKGKALSQTSSSSSKLLHGGIRYLENFQFSMVKEALQERKWWIDNVPDAAHPLEILIPIFKDTQRSGIKYNVGIKLYNFLAGQYSLGKSDKYKPDAIKDVKPLLKEQGFKYALSFYDGQMQEEKLGQWVLDKVLESGGIIKENTPVEKITREGNITALGEEAHFDVIINAAGPWSSKILSANNIESKFELDLVRGSHILVNKCIGDKGFLLEVPNSHRIFFVLPYDEAVLIGTTEERQSIDEPIVASKEEINLLIDAYNHYFSDPIAYEDIIKTYAGVRPLIKSTDNPSEASREYEIEMQGRVLSVFGGKWTTSMALARHVAEMVKDYY